MGKVRNLFAISVGRYTKPALERIEAFQTAKILWVKAAEMLTA
jgi:putative transposase